MRFLILFTALLLSPNLFAQLSVSIKPSQKEFIAYEAINVEVTIRNQSGRDLTLRNTPTNNGWIDFVVRNQSGRVVHTLAKQQYSPAQIATGKSIKSTFTLNQAYTLDLPGNYSVYAIVRMPNQAGDQGTRSRASFFTINRGAVKWSTKVGVPGVSGDEREYRIISAKSAPQTPPQLYVQVEDVKRGRILVTYSMGRYLSFRKPQYTIDRKNNLHVLFLVSPELHCHTIVNTQGKTIKRTYLKSIGSGHPALVTESNGNVYANNSTVYDPEQERKENEKFHDLSELPGGFTQ